MNRQHLNWLLQICDWLNVELTKRGCKTYQIASDYNWTPDTLERHTHLRSVIRCTRNSLSGYIWHFDRFWRQQSWTIWIDIILTIDLIWMNASWLTQHHTSAYFMIIEYYAVKSICLRVLMKTFQLKMINDSITFNFRFSVCVCVCGCVCAFLWNRKVFQQKWSAANWKFMEYILTFSMVTSEPIDNKDFLTWIIILRI